MKKRRTYSMEFKRDALRLAETSGKPIAQIERDLGITEGLLHKWKSRYQLKDNENGKATVEPSELEAVRAENRRLRRELAIAQQERDILKKAVSIFSKMEP